MSKWIGIFVIACSSLCADVAVVGDCRATGPLWNNPTSGWNRVNANLKKHGEELYLSSLSDGEMSRLMDPSTSVILMNNLPEWTRPDWREVLAKIPAKKILICWEPAVVIPGMYTKEAFKHFDIVLTWNSSLVDNKKFFQFYYPCLRASDQGMLPFKERHLLTQISGDKRSLVPHEEYSLRRKAIRFFEKHPHKDFCFYGRGWNAKKYHKYGGELDKKISCLQKYRFSLCFENMSHVKGYVTEKIFDCFAAKCVPVYFGASDIEKIIPKGCYIRWKDFKSFKKLYSYLEKMPEQKYLKFLRNAQQFMESPRAHHFTEDAFGTTIVRVIQHAKLCHKKHYVLKEKDESTFVS